jgi:hypothetical protein
MLKLLFNITLTLAGVIRWIFHPVLVPVWITLLIFGSGTYLSHLPFEAKKAILIITVIATILIPAALISLSYFINALTGVILSDKIRYIRSILLFTASLFFGWYTMQRVAISPLFPQVMLSLAFLSLLLTLINIKWHVSIYTAGIGAMLAVVFIVSLRLSIQAHLPVMMLTGVAGLVGFERLAGDKESPCAVYTGIVIGFLMLFIPLYIFN